jgi:hypothetical protein
LDLLWFFSRRAKRKILTQCGVLYLFVTPAIQRVPELATDAIPMVGMLREHFPFRELQVGLGILAFSFLAGTRVENMSI